MAVYVNKLRTRFGGLSLCHLLADSLDELHAMAARIGLERNLFNLDMIPHYDLSRGKRLEAIAEGAVVIDRQQLAILAQRFGGGVS
jgi:hypothetical protein